MGIFLAQCRGEIGVAISQIYGGDAAFRRGDEHAPQRTRGNRVGNVHPASPSAIGCGRHAQLRVRLLVKAARGAVGNFMQCCGHVFPLSQFGFEPRHAKRVRILPRRDSHRLAERALQVSGAQPRAFRKAPQRKRAVRVALDFAAHASDEIRLRVAARLARMAAPAGSESGLFRRFRLNEEKNLLRVRAARRAGRPAVDSRRADRIDERAIHSRVVQSDCRKAFPPRERGDCGQQRVGNASTLAVRFLPNHNIQNHSRGAIRILRSN